MDGFTVTGAQVLAVLAALVAVAGRVLLLAAVLVAGCRAGEGWGFGEAEAHLAWSVAFPHAVVPRQFDLRADVGGLGPGRR